MRISNETKEQIRKSEGEFFADVTKVVMKQYIESEDLFKNMGMECPKDESESVYNLLSGMCICEQYKNEYWYAVFRYAIFFKEDIIHYFNTHQKYSKLKESSERAMYKAWWSIDNDLKYLFDKEI